MPNPRTPAETRPEHVSLSYRVVMAVAAPIVRWWGRLEVVGLDTVPVGGGVLIMANHDSMWDPVVIGLAAPHRQIRALAKSSLWNNPIVSRVLDGMGQIPIERGRGDATALSAAIDALVDGSCIGVFPEGTRSGGRPLRALSGAGRLALAAPATTVVAASATGVVDIVRFPKRPRIRVEFFRPNASPDDQPSAVTLTKQVMAQVRERAPYVASGRSRAAAAETEGSDVERI